MKLADFIEARLDEWDENSACAGSGEYRSCDEWSEWHEQIIAAMRSVVELHAGEPCCETCYDIAPMDSPCPSIRALASIWPKHPDFDSAWK